MDHDAAQPTVAYIASNPYSGSTLLAGMIGAYHDALSVGELHYFADRYIYRANRQCVCGALFQDCPLWAGVRDHLNRVVGPEADFDIQDTKRRQFQADNRRLYEAITAVSGRSLIVDSSKRLRRLRKLQGIQGVDLRVIHLLRDPSGEVHSRVCRGDRWLPAAVRRSKDVLRFAWHLRRIPHLVVRYRDLTGDPEPTLRRVMAFLDRDFQPEQLQAHREARHDIGGSVSVLKKTAEIRYDSRWQDALTQRQQHCIRWLDSPCRLIGRGG